MSKSGQSSWPVRAISSIGRTIKNFFKWYIGLFRHTPWWKKTIAAILSFIVFVIVYLGAVDINFLGLFGRSPGFSQIKKPTTAEASEIYSADSVLLGRFFNENRQPVKYEDINPVFWKALIDTEDERFYQHFGIDFQGIVGAMKDALTKNDGRGASTITQQLAKNMFRVRTQYSTGLLGNIPVLRILIMKSKEWIIATKLEMMYDKKDILTMYANTVDFGSNAFGIKTACKTYFNTLPKDLTPEKAATLVGMLKATTYYNPILHPDNSIKRRNVVMMNMVNHNDLTHEAYDTLSTKGIELDYSVEKTYDGQATYFREAVAKKLKNWCEEEGYDLYTSGLKIYTTIDTKMQKYAEEAAKKQMRIVQQNFKAHWAGRDPWVDERGNVIPGFIEDKVEKLPYYKKLLQSYNGNKDSVYAKLNEKHIVKLFDYDKGSIEKEMSTIDSLKYMLRFMHCAFVAMEPKTGYVKAWVGDVDFETWKYDKVTAPRQPGSTFKLFVYTEAMNQGLTPCDKRRDEYFSMMVYDSKKKEEVRWAPTNANGYFTGDSIPLKSAFAQSINSVAVRIGQEVGISNIAKTAAKMGIESKLDNTPSLALGSSDVELLELVNAYCTVANDGVHHDPVLVTKIVDHDGNVVYVDEDKSSQAISYKSAFLMQKMLKAVCEGGGTGTSLIGHIGNAYRDTDFGGKTGTSNNHSDAWFMGVTPKLVVGAWVGGEYRSIHFRTGALGQGSRTALPICGYFLKSLYEDGSFNRYRGKWPKSTDPDIVASMYECSYWRPKAEVSDSDSIADEVMIELDENGNPITPVESPEGTINEENSTINKQESEQDNRTATPNAVQESTERKKEGKKPSYEKVTLDNL